MDLQTLEQYAKHLNIPIEELDIYKADKNGKTGGAISIPDNLVIKSMFENQQNMYDHAGVRKDIPFIKDIELRRIEKTTPPISIITNNRCRQIREFSEPSDDINVPGWQIILADKDHAPTKKEESEMKEIQDWFYYNGIASYKDFYYQEDLLLHDVLVMNTRDALVIDKIAIELVKNRVGDVIKYCVVDPATIKKVLPGGYRGAISNIDPRVYNVMNDEFMEKWNKAKLKNVPPLEEIAYVQEIQGRIVAAYKEDDFIFDIMQKTSDINRRGWGYSCTEQSLNVITSFLNAFAFNMEAFNTGAIPKLAIAMKDGGFSQEQLRKMSMEWVANFRGLKGQWRIPFINGQAEVLDILKNNRDMEYQKFLEFNTSMIAAVFGYDLMESGLKFFSTGNTLNENQDARQQFSKDRGLRDLLGFHRSILNKILLRRGITKYRFRFNGLDPKDREYELKLKKMESETYKMVDQIRAEEDDKPLPDGEGQVILNPTWIQWLQYKQQQKMMEEQAGAEEEMPEEEAGYEEDVDSAIDESFGEMAKARTMLI